jgi:ABC-type amino acid transport substrate-binding protein
LDDETVRGVLLHELVEFGGDDTTDAVGAAAKSDKVPTTDVVSAIRKDEASVKLLRADVKSLTAAISVGGSPPGTTYLDDGKTLPGQDVDFANAVAKVLGIRLKTEQASFEAILPALDSGKYDVGRATSASRTNAGRRSTSSPTSATARASPPARTASCPRSPTCSRCAA